MPFLERGKGRRGLSPCYPVPPLHGVGLKGPEATQSVPPKGGVLAGDGSLPDPLPPPEGPSKDGVLAGGGSLSDPPPPFEDPLKERLKGRLPA